MQFTYRKTFVNGVFVPKITLSSSSQNLLPKTFTCKNCIVGAVQSSATAQANAALLANHGKLSAFSMFNGLRPRALQQANTASTGSSVGLNFQKSSSTTSGGSDLILDTSLMGGIWFYSNGLGAYYTIGDTNGMNVHYMGTMCTDSNGKRITDGMCDIDLSPGCYVFRVDGAFDPDIDDITWEFCDARGGAKTQLTFCIDQNLHCKPTKVETAEEICANIAADFSSSTLSVAGTFHLGGMETAQLSDKDTSAIRSALIKEFSDASDSPHGQGVVELSKLSWIPADPKAFDIASNEVVSVNDRRLDNKMSMASISFEVKILAERFGLKTVDESGLSNLHLHMDKYLTRSMSVGVFVSKLVTAARSVDSKNLQSVNFAQLGTIKVTHKAIVSNEISILASVLVIGSVMIGIGFSYMTYQSVTKGSKDNYDSLSPDSRHDLITPDVISE